MPADAGPATASTSANASTETRILRPTDDFPHVLIVPISQI